MYCYIRGSHYGSDLTESLKVKSNATELLKTELSQRAGRGQYGIIVLGSSTDPYLDIEANLKLTRALLEIIAQYQFPVHIITKGTLVERDIDLLHEINRRAILPLDLQGKVLNKAIVTFSFSCLDSKTAKIFEPLAPSPLQRLRVMKNLSENGVYTGVSLMPLLPYVTDPSDEVEIIINTIKNYGAQYVFPAGLSLNVGHNSNSEILLKVIKKFYPELESKYQNLISNSGELERRAKQVRTYSIKIARDIGLKTSLI